jgi:hypothetical protein
MSQRNVHELHVELGRDGIQRAMFWNRTQLSYIAGRRLAAAIKKQRNGRVICRRGLAQSVVGD